MKLGARTFKTGLAVALSIIIAQYFTLDNGVIAGISAVASTQPSLGKSYKNLKQRLLANTIGGMVAVICASTIGTNIYITALAAMLLIALLNSLKLGDVISLAVMTLIIIMTTNSDSLFLDATFRVLETFVGVIVSFLVNTFVYPPRYDIRLYHTIDYATSEFLIWIRASLRKNTEFSVLNRDLKWAKKQLGKMEYLCDLLRESSLPLHKNHVETLKQLVVYRKMISSARAAYKVLKVLHDYENIFYHFPKDLRIQVRERLETLMSGHEQIMLKFTGRVPVDQVNFFESNWEERTALMDAFFQRATIESAEDSTHHSVESFGVIHLMSAILDYEDELIHFNKLVRNYRSQYDTGKKQLSSIDEIMS